MYARRHVLLQFDIGGCTGKLKSARAKFPVTNSDVCRLCLAGKGKLVVGRY